jgi:hypothetical protein
VTISGSLATVYAFFNNDLHLCAFRDTALFARYLHPRPFGADWLSFEVFLGFHPRLPTHAPSGQVPALARERKARQGRFGSSSEHKGRQLSDSTPHTPGGTARASNAPRAVASARTPRKPTRQWQRYQHPTLRQRSALLSAATLFAPGGHRSRLQNLCRLVRCGCHAWKGAEAPAIVIALNLEHSGEAFKNV